VIADDPSRGDAAAVAALRAAGAIVLGKHVTNEFALGQTRVPTQHPWDPALYPGGSTVGGAVAVAVGSAYAALGTDSGGSIRKPATINGIVGMKPTYGRISRVGVVPPSGSLDTVGPLTRTVEDARLVLAALLTSTERAPVPTGEQPRRQRIGLPSQFFGPELEPDVGDAVREAIAQLAELGAELVPMELPNTELVIPAGQVILAAEAAASHRTWLRERGPLYSPGTRRALILGALVPATDLANALRARALVRRGVAQVFADHALDAIAGPTLPSVAVPLATMDPGNDLAGINRYTMLASLTGAPSLSVPCGLSGDGLPVGMMLTGRPDDEETLLDIGTRYQQVTSWHTHRPPLAVEETC
jgi:aspartyl-tRNA(Asn)/glutamyl-tRNA(Gln) amidotransferase subunit A